MPLEQPPHASRIRVERDYERDEPQEPFSHEADEAGAILPQAHTLGKIREPGVGGKVIDLMLRSKRWATWKLFKVER